MNFSFCAISRDEEKTLPRLIASLKPFQERGGACVLLDTGSTDRTVEIARAAGWIVEEVGEIYLHKISPKLAKAINKQFIVEGEEDCVKAGDRYFDFASARNACAALSPTDWVFWADADEQVTTMDIDKIEALIDSGGVDHFEYEFIFSHRPDGSPALQFIQSKAYDRTKLCWGNLVHEVLQPLKPSTSKGEMYLSTDVFLLEHFQQPHDRHSYLKGLAVDCYLHPDSDRNSHYYARELMYSNRPKSAIKEFKRHIAMNKWPAERAQSCIFIGDCYGQLNNPEEQVVWYSKAFHTDPSRREALIRLANFYKYHNNPQAALCYATAALEIPWHGFYANNKDHYEHEPHEIIAWASGWLGNIPAARKHLLKALDYQPTNARYLEDMRYYFEYWGNNIDGWMSQRELQFLFEMGRQMETIVEIGSWKGRSTHALASGGNKVTAVDTFKGSDDETDLTNSIAKREDIEAQFRQNLDAVKDNLTVMVMESKEAAKQIGKVDSVFIDALHTYEGVKADIELWTPHATKMICGDDYLPGVWDGVVQAVDEMFGKPDRVIGKIWIKYLDDARPTLPDYL